MNTETLGSIAAALSAVAVALSGWISLRRTSRVTDLRELKDEMADIRRERKADHRVIELLLRERKVLRAFIARTDGLDLPPEDPELAAALEAAGL